MDFYLAQIAAETRRGQVKNPKRIRIRDFLLQYTNQRTSQESNMSRSKAAWAAALRVPMKEAL